VARLKRPPRPPAPHRSLPLQPQRLQRQQPGTWFAASAAWFPPFR